MVGVLIGDSQPLFAQALARALEHRAGMQVLEPYPSSGVAAAQAAVVHQPDVALLDFWLEGLTAPAVTASITAKAPATRVIVLGWFHGPEQVGQAFAAGAAGFVSKSLRIDELVEVIERVVAGELIVADGANGHGDGHGNGHEHGDREFGGRASLAIAAADASDTNRDAFTPRELEVLRLLGAGLTVEDVADHLTVSYDTARTHLRRVLTKTGARSQLQAVAFARQQGLLL